jgi:uncharacterized protein YjbK
MTEHLEIELKWRLDADGHARLASHLSGLLGTPRVLEQDNRFFDSPDRRLRQAALNLRLRRENDALLMTCKGRGGVTADGEHRHTEWELWLDPSAWEAIAAGHAPRDLPLPEVVRSALGDAPLCALGGFTNQRLEFHHHDEPTALLCLDRTHFPGGRTDHELEIETAAPATHAPLWAARLDGWGVPFSPQPLTKFGRFLALSP